MYETEVLRKHCIVKVHPHVHVHLRPHLMLCYALHCDCHCHCLARYGCAFLRVCSCLSLKMTEYSSIDKVRVESSRVVLAPVAARHGTARRGTWEVGECEWMCGMGEWMDWMAATITADGERGQCKEGRAMGVTIDTTRRAKAKAKEGESDQTGQRSH